MPVSGTFAFDMDVGEILDEAFDKVGREHISGREAKSARRKLNLLLIEMQNKEIPLNRIDDVTVTVASSVAEYTMSVNVNDILQVNLRRDSQDLPMTRYSLYEYHNIVPKNQVGRPTIYTTERNRDSVILKVWPQPENNTDTFEIKFFEKIDDVTRSAGQHVNLNTRFLPAIVNILAYELAKSREGIPENKMLILKRDAEESWEWVKNEDRERATKVIVPKLRSPLR